MKSKLIHLAMSIPVAWLGLFSYWMTTRLWDASWSLLTRWDTVADLVGGPLVLVTLLATSAVGIVPIVVWLAFGYELHWAKRES